MEQQYWFGSMIVTVVDRQGHQVLIKTDGVKPWWVPKYSIHPL